MQNPIPTLPNFQNPVITQTKLEPPKHAPPKQALNQRHHRHIKPRPREAQARPNVHHLAPREDRGTQPVHNAPGRVVIQFFPQELLGGGHFSLGGGLELERHGLVGGELAAEVGGVEGVEDEDGVGPDREEGAGDGVGAVGRDGEWHDGEEGVGGEGEDGSVVVGEGEGEFWEDEGGERG